MFCCRRGTVTSFTPNHELDSVINRKKRAGSEKSVVSTQPEASSDRPGAGAETNENAEAEEKEEDKKDVDVEANQVEVDVKPQIFNNKKEDSNDTNEEEYDPRRQEGRRGGYRARKVDTTTEIPSHPKSNQVAEALKCAILNNEFLRDIVPAHVIDQVVQAMAPRDVEQNELIIKQGDIGDQFYVNEKGSYKVIVDQDVVAEINTPKLFGELAMLYQQRRAATIQAVSPGRIWSLDGAVYQTLMIKDARFEEEQRLRFLKEVKSVKSASHDKLRQIARLLKTNFYPAHKDIVKQGDVGDKFYMIKAGKVTVRKDGVVVANLGEGDYFGEKALMSEADVRQATCSTEPPGVMCYELSRQEFIDCLGDFESFVTKRPTPRDTVERERSVAVEISVGEEAPSFDQLFMLATIGEGGFGRVKLVKVTNGDRHYALKMLSKVDNNSEEQRQHVRNEKDIHKRCKSFFIVQLYATYADSRYLYFLMEVCMGGDLFSRMQREKGRCFSEDNARFVAACILEALVYLHSKNYIYRDLKPENMLIDQNGYIKLADFGFARHLEPSAAAYTFAGTPEYVAPEVIYNKGHNRAVDYWAFGIFIYELIAGKTPFKSNDPSYMITYGLILKGIDNIQFSKQIGKQATILIKRLCKLTPHERLGCKKGGVDEIRNHKWFQNFKWKDLQERKMESKFFKPKLSHEFDTAYFDDYDEDYPEPPVDHSDYWKDFDSFN